MTLNETILQNVGAPQYYKLHTFTYVRYVRREVTGKSNLSVITGSQ